MPRDLLFKFWDPPNISGTAEGTKLKFSKQIGRLIVRDTKPKNEQWVKRGSGLGHVTYFSNFGTPNISGTAEGTKLKYSRQIDRNGY